MEFMKKIARILRLIFGWILIVMGGFGGVTAGICGFCALFGLLEITSLAERLVAIVTYLAMTIGFFTILRLGIRLKNSGKNKIVDPAEMLSSPKPENSPDEYLDDITFILNMRHIASPDSSWQQYDVVLNAGGHRLSYGGAFSGLRRWNCPFIL